MMGPLRIVLYSKEESSLWSDCEVMSFGGDPEEFIEKKRKEGYKFFYFFKQSGYFFDLTDNPQGKVYKDFDM